MNTKLTFIQKHSYSFLIGFILILFLFLFFGCSARNVSKEEIKKDSSETKKIEVAVKVKETIKENTKIDSTSKKNKKTNVNIFEEGLEIEPIDPKIESSFTDSNGNTQTFKNARLKTKKTKDNSIVEETEITRKIKEKESKISKLKDSIYILKSKLSTNEKAIKKLTEKKQYNWNTFILWVLIIIVLYLCFRYFKGLIKFQ